MATLKKILDAILTLIMGKDEWRIEYVAQLQPHYKVPYTRGILTVYTPDGQQYLQIPAGSGGGGRGCLPNGRYLVTEFIQSMSTYANADAYALHGISFFCRIEPQFDTDRTELGIHPDGNALGTLGCIGIFPNDTLSTVEQLERAKKVFSDVTGWCKDGVRLDVRQAGI